MQFPLFVTTDRSYSKCSVGWVQQVAKGVCVLVPESSGKFRKYLVYSSCFEHVLGKPFTLVRTNFRRSNGETTICLHNSTSAYTLLSITAAIHAQYVIPYFSFNMLCSRPAMHIILKASIYMALREHYIYSS